MRALFFIMGFFLSQPLFAYFSNEGTLDGLSYRSWMLVDEPCAYTPDKTSFAALNDPFLENSSRVSLPFQGCFAALFEVDVTNAGLYSFIHSGFVQKIILVSGESETELPTFFENDSVVTDVTLRPGHYKIYSFGRSVGRLMANRWGLGNAAYRVMPSHDYHRTSFLTSAVRGMCLGVLGIMALFFLFMARENNRVFLIYGAFISLNILFMESIRSLGAELVGMRGGQYYFADWPLLTQVLGCLTQLLVGVFFASFYEIKQRHPRFYKFFQAMYVAIMLEIPMIIFKVPYGQFYTSAAIAIGALTLVGTAIVYSFTRGGLYHLISVGYGVMLSGTQYFVLTSLGVIEADHFWSRDMHLLGSTFEVILFSVATSLKLNNTFAQQKKENDHVLSQLQKIVYPHQLRQIREGSTLEQTMPTGKAEACVLAFDIIGSSQIQHERVKDFIERSIELCISTMYERYDAERLTADAYRIKVVGDGFLCSIGYPFGTPASEPDCDAAVRLAMRMVKTFDQVEKEFGYHLPIHCAIGVAHGSIEAYYPQVGTREYDLYGSGIVLATRYEQLRKQLFSPEDADYIILQERVYASLSPELQREFACIELLERKIRVRDDDGARRVYVWQSREVALSTIVA